MYEWECEPQTRVPASFECLCVQDRDQRRQCSFWIKQLVDACRQIDHGRYGLRLQCIVRAIVAGKAEILLIQLHQSGVQSTVNALATPTHIAVTYRVLIAISKSFGSCEFSKGPKCMKLMNTARTASTIAAIHVGASSCAPLSNNSVMRSKAYATMHIGHETHQNATGALQVPPT
jgi:hypothetical protein